jgi:hypothetical protein
VNLIDLPPSVYVPIATALTSVIVVLWRRDVARSDREAKRLELITDRLNNSDCDS